MEKKTKNKRFLKSSRRATKSMAKVGKKSVKAKVTKRVQHTPKAVKANDKKVEPRHSTMKNSTFRASFVSFGDGYSVIKEDCNDYFVCNKCYKDDSIIFTFDAAYEAGFKCGSCGGKFDMINKNDAMELINQDRQKQEAALLSLRASAENQSINMALPLPQQKKQFK